MPKEAVAWPTQSKVSVLNAFNQQTSTFQQLPSPQVTTTYAYDNNGNLLTETTGSNVKSYAWDADNRLRQLTLPNGGGTHAYEYDANGLRVMQTTPTGTTRYLLDGPTVLEELDSLGNTTASYLTNPLAIDEILSFAKGGATYYPLTDALGSLVAITDASGAVVKSCTYDVYGARTCSGSGPDIAFGHTGREHDASGLRYHRDRYADAASGRWQQPDRLGFVDGWNRYQYARGNPTRLTDPTGELIYADDPDAWEVVADLAADPNLGPFIDDMERSFPAVIQITSLPPEDPFVSEDGATTDSRSRPTIVIRYNLSVAQRLSQAYVGETISLDQLLAHELGHAYYRSEVDPENLWRQGDSWALDFENARRGKLRLIHHITACQRL